MKKLSVIVPCYNEEKNVGLFYAEIQSILKKIKYKIELVFINDGSTDNTLDELKKISQEKECIVKIINFSRNFGKESGIYAGLENCTGDYAVIIDADLQQNPKLILEMIKTMEKNPEYDAVAFYQQRRNEGRILGSIKRIYYRIINKLTDIEFVPGASDFRMISRPMVDAILRMSERNRFTKGIFSWIGFKTCYLPYQAEQRQNGRSTWSFFKLVGYGFNGIISFSTIPLKIATVSGILTSLFAFLYLIIVIIQKLFFGIDVPGYATIVVLILFLGGLQLIVIGIFGEYLAKTYNEVKRRPIYIAREVITNEKINKRIISKK